MARGVLYGYMSLRPMCLKAAKLIYKGMPRGVSGVYRQACGLQMGVCWLTFLHSREILAGRTYSVTDTYLNLTSKVP